MVVLYSVYSVYSIYNLLPLPYPNPNPVDAYLVSMFPSGQTVSSLESCRSNRGNNSTDICVSSSTSGSGSSNGSTTSVIPTPIADPLASIQTKILNDRRCYMCVADGVGGWREYGIDPRLYAYTLVEHAKKSILDVKQTGQAGHTVKHPDVIIAEAWESTAKTCIETEKIIESGLSGPDVRKIQGSSTLCVATIDLDKMQLEYSNIGDSGLMVLRHIGVDRVGYLRYVC